jgi:hypothetical protein
MPAELISVAQLFIKLREHRSLVDYDNSKQWSAADVETVIEAGYAAAHREAERDHEEPALGDVGHGVLGGLM